jgi:hypothetical protein
MFGGDLSEPYGVLIFRRCLQDPELLLGQRFPFLRRSAPQAGRQIQSGTAQGPTEALSDNSRQLRPLAAGVNKGNVDSGEGARYYYFWAGPGRIQVRLAFQEMGILGAPLRQALTFDLLNETGRIMSHNAVVSETGLERIETSGDLANRQKIIIAVRPQAGLVRMGGYYEIEVIGAAAFDKTAPDTTKVVPRDTRLIQRSGVTADCAWSIAHNRRTKKPSCSWLYPGPLSRSQQTDPSLQVAYGEL